MTIPLITFLTIGGLFAALVGVIAAILSKLDGASLPAALLRGGAAFGGSYTLILILLTVTLR